MRKKTVILILAFLFFAPFFPYGAAAQDDERKKEIRALIEAVIDTTDEGRRGEIVLRLRGYPPDEVGEAWLSELERSRRPATVVRVIEAMGEFPDRRFVPAVAQYLIHPHAPVRRAAAAVLKKIGDDRLYPVILRMADSDVPVHRIYFIEAMNYLYDHRFYQSLAQLMREENKSIRIYVIRSFKENRVTEAIGLIRSAAFGDRNEEVRAAAVEALGQIRDAGSLNVIHAALNDASREVRRTAVVAIGLIGSALSAGPLSSRLAVEEDAEIRERILDALVRLKRVGETRGIERVLLSDPNPALRIKAAFLLGCCAGQQGFAALVRGTEDADYRVRAEACYALGNVRNRQSLGVLFDVMGRDEPIYVKSAALYAVKKINDKSSLLGLFELYARERDPVFKEILYQTVREYIKRNT